MNQAPPSAAPPPNLHNILHIVPLDVVRDNLWALLGPGDKRALLTCSKDVNAACRPLVTGATLHGSKLTNEILLLPTATRFPQLQRLELVGVLPYSALPAVAGILPSLTSLSFDNWCCLPRSKWDEENDAYEFFSGVQALEVLSASSTLTKLETLHVKLYSQLGVEQIEELARSAGAIRNLRSLTLDLAVLHRPPIAAYLTDLTQLTQLNISGSYDADVIAWLQTLPSLRDVLLQANASRPVPRMPHLTQLSVEYVDDEDATNVAALAAVLPPSLQDLTIWGGDSMALGAALMARLTALTGLASLTVMNGGQALSVELAQHMPALTRLTSLFLHIERFIPEEEGDSMPELAQLALSLTCLTALQQLQWHMDYELAAFGQALLSLTQLRCLMLSTYDAPFASPVAHLTRLTTLELPRVADLRVPAGLVELLFKGTLHAAAQDDFNRLRCLTLLDTGLPDNMTMAAVAALLMQHAPPLESLTVYTGEEDDAANILPLLPALPRVRATLRSLHIIFKQAAGAETPTLDDGLAEQLAVAVSSLPNLQRVCLSHRLVSYDLVAKFAACFF